MSTRAINLSVTDDVGRRLKDPADSSIYHFETYLPFTEAAKLDRGNANVRPAKANHPFQAMVDTVETSPELFHIKNRGITYICTKFSYDNQSKTLVVEVPNIPKSKLRDEGAQRFGIADGGHTFKVIEDVVRDLDTYQEDEDWTVPF